VCVLQQQNYFQLFALPVTFFIDIEKLADAYRKLQRQFHPDRYVSASAQEQRIALQYATVINEAYQSLKSPLLRAQYLLELMGFVQKEHTMQADPDFLMQQMDWREQLESCSKDAARLAHLLEQVEQRHRDLQQQFADAYADENYSVAQHMVDKMHFVSKFEQELGDRLASLSEV
jgi:molecular chaperone HscB